MDIPKARYYVSIHPDYCGNLRKIKKVVDAIGPANAVATALDPGSHMRLIAGAPTRDGWRGTRWTYGGNVAFAYEVTPDAPLGTVTEYIDSIVSEYGIRAPGKARTGMSRPPGHQTNRVLPPDAADEIERLSNEVERLRGRITELVVERNNAELRYEEEHRLRNEEHNEHADQVNALRVSVHRLQDDNRDLHRRIEGLVAQVRRMTGWTR